MRDADAVVRVGQGVLEKCVGNDGACISKAEQRMVREHSAQAQQAANEQGLQR